MTPTHATGFRPTTSTRIRTAMATPRGRSSKTFADEVRIEVCQRVPPARSSSARTLLADQKRPFLALELQQNAGGFDGQDFQAIERLAGGQGSAINHGRGLPSSEKHPLEFDGIEVGRFGWFGG